MISSSDSLVFSRACAAAGGSVWKRASRSAADAKMGSVTSSSCERVSSSASTTCPQLTQGQDTDTQR